ncbi:protein phosphatase 2C domain-containing protein [Paenibacillus sp. AK002]
MRPHIVKWHGSSSMFLDDPQTIAVSHGVLGRYGGSSATGADKNEDGVYIWIDAESDMEFALLLDAHETDESAQLLLSYIDEAASEIAGILRGPIEQCFRNLHDYLLGMLTSERFREDCRGIAGETSCLLCCRREEYLWWFNVGDCLLYLLHPELTALGQTLLNQRNFYEWIGKVNTFDKQVPCYSTGVRELRSGKNVIVLSTDGALEMGPVFLEHIKLLFDADLEDGVKDFMQMSHEHGIKDSVTMIAWQVELGHHPSYPSVGSTQELHARQIELN